MLPVDFVCSSKYGEEPGEASCVSNLLLQCFILCIFVDFLIFLHVGYGNFGSKIHIQTCTKSMMLLADWQDGEIKSATVETGIPEGDTEDSPVSVFQQKSQQPQQCFSPPKKKTIFFFLVNMTFTHKHLKCCLPPVFSIHFVLDRLDTWGTFFWQTKITTHPAVSVVSIVSPLCVCQVLWVDTSDLLDDFWNAKMR